MLEKRCTRCKKNKNLEDFSLDSRTKDGRQKWCKDCWSAYHEHKLAKGKENKVSALEINKAQKLQKLLTTSAEMGGDMIGAYQAIHGNKTRESAQNQLYHFMECVSQSETLSAAAKKVTQSSLFKAFVDKYLNLCFESNNPTFMRDAIMTMGKLAGDLVDKREVTTVNPDEAAQAFESKMDTLLTRMEEKN